MQKLWRETIFFHGLKASFTFLLSHTFFLKILLFSCRLSLVCTKYVTNRKWEIVLLRDNLLFVKNYCNDSPRIFRKVFPCVKIIKENNELSSCRPWFSDFLVVYYAGPCATLLNFLEYSFDNVTCTGYLFLLWINRNWLRIQSCIFVALKFRYSEKATQIWAIFHFIFDIT